MVGHGAVGYSSYPLSSFWNLQEKHPPLYRVENICEYITPLLKVNAGPVGIEPTLSVLETDVLPLNYGPRASTITELLATAKRWG
jgi:hypothetical protein